MAGTLTRWTDADGDYAVSVEPDPDTGDVTIMSEFTELGHTDQLTIPAAAIPWLQRALGRITP